MSTNVVKRKIDQRIRRTRDRLGDALMQLALEKPFDTITVQNVLDRAEVSRSTFYVHYNDKDDLFISDLDEFFEGMATMLSRRADPSDRVAPVRELFAHIADPHGQSISPHGLEWDKKRCFIDWLGIIAHLVHSIAVR